MFAIKVVRPKFTKKNPPEGTKLNELYKKRRGTSQMSEQFGPHFAPGSFALQQSIRLVYTLRALSRGRNRATKATRDNQDAQTQKEHTRSATETQHNSQPETPKGSWPLLLPSRRRRRRRCFCCCCCHIRVPLLRVPKKNMLCFAMPADLSFFRYEICIFW